MTTDTDTTLSQAGPRILVTGDPAFTHPDISAAVRPYDPEAGAEGAGAIWHLPPGAKPPPGAALCVVDGLAAAAAAVMAAPEALSVVPRAEVRRVAQRFGFTPGQAVSGFSTYQLDPASVSAHEVLEEDRHVGLSDWLALAAGLGFGEVWLHSPGAEAEAQGFPCALLTKAHKLAPEMRFWISGGGHRLPHFATAAARRGLTALVVPAEIVAGFAAGELAAAITPAEVTAGRGAA